MSRNKIIMIGGGGGGSGDVTAASGFGTDNVLLRSDGTGKGVQSTGITVDDNDVMTNPGSIIRPPETVTVTEASPDTATFAITVADGTVTIDEATTIAFSSAGTLGQSITRTIVNSTSSPVVVTLTNCTPTTTTIAALGQQTYCFKSTGSAWIMLGGDPYGIPGALTFVVDGAGSSVATGTKKSVVQAQRAGVITGWTLLGNESGSIVVDVWKDIYTNYPPTDADSITASALPTMTAATKATSSTLTGWTTAFAAGDIFKINVDSVTTTTYFTLILHVFYF